MLSYLKLVSSCDNQRHSQFEAIELTRTIREIICRNDLHLYGSCHISELKNSTSTYVYAVIISTHSSLSRDKITSPCHDSRLERGR